MIRVTLLSFFTVAAVAVAHAEDAKILRIDPRSHAGHEHLVAAAEQLCRSAKLHDLFDDYGTQEECVENTLQGVHPQQMAGAGEYRANNSAQISSAR